MEQWLMHAWLNLPFDLEPVRELFDAGYEYRVEGDNCLLFLKQT